MLEAFAMNEERVLALAGLYQACALTEQLANQGRCDEGALEASLASVFRIDAPSVVAVYGAIADLRADFAQCRALGGRQPRGASGREVVEAREGHV